MNNLSFSSILFICLGNICRSPLAEGIFRNSARKRGLADVLTIDSAGTGGWHVGDPPDHRSINIAAKYGIDISHQTCRRLIPEDFHRFDVILGMDQSNLANAASINTQNGPAQLRLFTEFAGMGQNIEISDPYYGGPEGFDEAFRLISEASENLLELKVQT